MCVATHTQCRRQPGAGPIALCGAPTPTTRSPLQATSSRLPTAVSRSSGERFPSLMASSARTRAGSFLSAPSLPPPPLFSSRAFFFPSFSLFSFFFFLFSSFYSFILSSFSLFPLSSFFVVLSFRSYFFFASSSLVPTQRAQRGPHGCYGPARYRARHDADLRRQRVVSCWHIVLLNSEEHELSGRPAGCCTACSRKHEQTRFCFGLHCTPSVKWSLVWTPLQRPSFERRNRRLRPFISKAAEVRITQEKAKREEISSPEDSSYLNSIFHLKHMLFSCFFLILVLLLVSQQASFSA